MNCELKLYGDDLAPQSAAPDALTMQPVRAIYVVSGALKLASKDTAATLSANSAWHGTGAVRVAAGNLATIALRWELVPQGAAQAMLAGDGISSRLLLSAK